MSIEIRIKGNDELIRKLKKVSKGLQFMRPAMQDIGAFLTGWYATIPFATGGGIYGQTWVPLTPQYAVQKAKKYPGRGILVASGNMMKSFRFEAGDSQVRIWNTAEYFANHQLGKGVPQRVIMKYDKHKHNGKVTEIIKNQVIKAIQNVR